MRAYRWLLRLYPASFRHEYGEEMTAVFARDLRGASNPIARVSLWLSTAADVAINATLVHLDILRQDLAYTLRMLRRSPGFAVAAALMIALGIGATTAAFSVTDFVLIRPLPFPEADRLVKIWETTPGYSRMELSAPNYRDIRAAATSFVSSGIYHAESLTLLDGGEPRRFVGSSVSAGLFATLRVAPLIGRTFTEADDREGAAPTLMLSYQLWRSEFGGDPNVVGRRVHVQVDFGEGWYTVIGVMPQEFHFPHADVLFWVTNRFVGDDYVDAERNNNWLEAVGRLQPGLTLEQARAEVEQLGARLRRAYPKENKDTGATVFALSDQVSWRSQMLLLALDGAAACVLLIACANLANLLLARAIDRRRELAVRTAIGAGRERLIRQLMTETLLLATAGAALGVTVASLAVPLLARLIPSTLPIAAAPTVDGRVLAFAVGVAALTTVAFGLVPVGGVRTGTALEGLRDGVRAGGGRRQRMRSMLVAAEIAASVVLLVCAGLLLRALFTIQSTDAGLKPDGVLTMRTELPMPQYRDVATRETYYARVLDEVRALPGVQSAGFISFLPMSSFRGGIWPVSVKGDPESSSDTRGANNVACLRYVTPGLFAALRIPLTRGRDLGAGDTRDRPYVAVVSESFAKRYWPGQDPIGRHFMFALADREVVGVVGDVKFRGLERESEPQVYLSSAQVDDGSITFYTPKALAVRSTATAPSALAPTIRAIIQRADSRVPITEVQTLADLVELDTGSRAAQLRVIAAFAAIAFILAGLGLHGLLSFVVSQRTQEIGVRIALGARPRDVVAMIAGDGARFGALGLGVGIVAAYASARSMQALLAGVNPGDVDTFAAAAGLAALMLVLGMIVPTLRALRVDPIVAIKSE